MPGNLATSMYKLDFVGYILRHLIFNPNSQKLFYRFYPQSNFGLLRPNAWFFFEKFSKFSSNFEYPVCWGHKTRKENSNENQGVWSK